MPVRQSEFRRYLAPIDTSSIQQLFTDCLVVGSGIAGLRAAIEAAGQRNVTLICKRSLGESNTWNAQGGVATVLGSEDRIEYHIADTIKTGCGLCDRDIVELVVSRGPELIGQLAEWGTEFDRTDGKIDITLEGGHSHARVAHAHGDSTGRGIAEALIRKVQAHPRIHVLEHIFAIDLITDDENQCLGVLGFRPSTGLVILWAAGTILATGGAGRLYRETTNPEVATADGLGMAYRAGASLRDMEFMQFHPTTLYIAGASRALITETLRGEGAMLVDGNGVRFMQEYHPSGELAPRDVVSRAILDRMLKTNSTHVYLDVRHFDKAHFSKRFPTISELCESFDIDVSHDLIPVRPSAHYMIGGVKTDAAARTSIRNLYACGEVASTCLHGANRLGSNSLLEGLVFGQIAGQSALQDIRPSRDRFSAPRMEFAIPDSDRSRLDTDDVRNALRALMWRNVGITRKETHLAEAEDIIHFWQRYVMDKVFDHPFGWECQNMLTVANLMATAARRRQESRGVHFRGDYPETNNKQFGHHIELGKSLT